MPAWSHSALKSFETCPRRYYLTNLTKKVREPQTQATLHGNEVHGALAKYMLGAAPLPGKYSAYQPYADKIKSSVGTKVIEERIALDRNLQPTQYFSKDVWVRGVFDVAVIGTKSGAIFDWKTGKRNLDGDQLKLFAAIGFSQYPYLQKIRTGFIWLAEGSMDTEVYDKEDAPKIWQEYIVRVQRLEDAVESDHFPPRPSGLCRKWCPVGKSLCEHCGD